MLARGFDLLLKLVASEWVLVNAEALRAVRSPEEHRGTFTEDLQRRWLHYVGGTGSELLQVLPFPNRWRKGMLDSAGFENMLHGLVWGGADGGQ